MGEVQEKKMMTENQADKELAAIQVMLDALKVLEKESQERAIEYVLQRLNIISHSRTDQVSKSANAENWSGLESSPEHVVDIRSLKNEKSPKTAIEMAVLVAFYLTEFAPVGERKSSINTDDLKKYFKEAKFKLPKYIKDTLPDAKTSGYLENVAKGEYRLTSVGYNLIVHGLPRSKAKS